MHRNMFKDFMIRELYKESEDNDAYLLHFEPLFPVFAVILGLTLRDSKNRGVNVHTGHCIRMI